jgi:hypothetical protein
MADISQTTWQQLLDGDHQPLIDAAHAIDDFSDVKAISTLRRIGDADLVRAAIELTLGRRRLGAKVDDPTQFIADAEGAEQATPLNISRHKASRYHTAGCESVADLCCGIGLDGVAIGQTAGVTLVDRDASRLWMAAQNVLAHGGTVVETMATDVTETEWASDSFDAIHIDPSRRGGGGRAWDVDQMEPSLAFLEQLAETTSLGAKLSPAIDFGLLPLGHVELIAAGRRLNQAMLWTGRLAFADPSNRTVTRLAKDGSVQTWTAEPDLPIPMTATSDHAWLLTVDPLVDRASLTGSLCEETDLESIHPALGLLVADKLIDNAWLTPYRHLATMPWRLESVRAWCRDHDAGEVTVKTRNKTVNPDVVSKKLRGKGEQSLTVFVLDHGRKRLAHLTETPEANPKPLSPAGRG